VSVALIGPPSIIKAAGGPTNLILSTLLVLCRHPADMYHLAQATSSVVRRAAGGRREHTRQEDQPQPWSPRRMNRWPQAG